jgi:hypothetical protein
MKIIVKTPLTDPDYLLLKALLSAHETLDTVPGPVPDLSPTVTGGTVTPIDSIKPIESYTAVTDPTLATAPAVDPVNVELDNNGIPWDARIHSTSKAKTADGNWRKLRNLDTNVFDLVMCELELARDADAAVFKPIAPPPPVAPLPADIAPPPVAIAPPPPPSAPAVNAPTFPEFIGKIGAAMSAGTLTTEIINAAIVAVGFSTVADIAKNPDLIPLVLSTLQAQGYAI